MKKIGKVVSTAVVLLGLALVVHSLLLHGDPAPREQESGNGKDDAAPARMVVQGGQDILTLNSASGRRLGLAEVELSETTVHQEYTAQATVLSAQALTTLRNGYVAADARLETARASLTVAHKEYLRLQSLYKENQNTSAKDVEAAEGTEQADSAELQAAQEQLTLQASLVHQQWGDAVAGWVTANSDTLQAVLQRREMLIQVTIPPDQLSPPPPSISLEIPAGRRIAARFVSSFPQVDPRIQGRSFLYVTPGRSDLAPGLNLIAHLPTDRLLRGFIVPQTAIVWSAGQPWVYQQISPNQFSRRPVATSTQVGSGFLVSSGFKTGEKIVVCGAQALLSEELLLQGQGGAEPDTD